jgi:hypothetical protein
MKYISMVLADKILSILEESGAKGSEKHAALEIVRALVPFTPGGVMDAERDDQEPHDTQETLYNEQ